MGIWLALYVRDWSISNRDWNLPIYILKFNNIWLYSGQFYVLYENVSMLTTELNTIYSHLMEK